MSVEIQVPEIVPLSSLSLLLPEGTNHNVIAPFKHEALRDDILRYGFDEPLQVWEDSGKLWVVNGHKRYAILKDAKSSDALVVRKSFKNRTEALAYSIRRNEERGNRDDVLVGAILQEISREFESIESMSKDLALTDRELYDVAWVDKKIDLPKSKQRLPGERSERLVVKVQLTLTTTTKSLLDRAIKTTLHRLGATDAELPHSVALEHILKNYLDNVED